MESCYYISQIIASVFIVGGVIVALWQYFLSRNDSKTNLAVIQVQRAIDLSEYYKDNILNYYPAIQYVFDRCGLSSVMESIRLDQLDAFDQSELSRLFSKEQVDKLKAAQVSREFTQAVLEANEIYGLGLRMPGLQISKQTDDDDVETVTLKVHGQTVVRAFMTDVKNKALNNLEFFAMHFSHNTADDSVVYQSLHQTYLEMVHLLYYFIAGLNNDASDKYYTNTIALFKSWKYRKLSQMKAQSDKTSDVVLKGTTVGN